MRLLTLALMGALLLLLPPPAETLRAENSLQEKTITAIQHLAEVLGELNESLTQDQPSSPTPNPIPGSEWTVVDMAGNLTETLLHLIDTIQENTRALTHLQQQQQQGQQGREEGVKCPPPFSMLGSECFYVNKYLRVSWGEARRFCQGLLADLATPKDVNSLRGMLLDKFPEDDCRFFWLGAIETTIEGVWEWVSKSRVMRREWASGQPDGGNENCAVLSRDEFPALHDSPCYAHTTFICQKSTMEPVVQNAH
ncbi:C-type lectin domain family 4 member D [Procambarus clarkii]|uniref:C-type lectin domain family 4 member D n=1 Tax=Procambarus clarkii TaxID=6728 RepID=UPI003742A3E1